MPRRLRSARLNRSATSAEVPPFVLTRRDTHGGTRWRAGNSLVYSTTATTDLDNPAEQVEPGSAESFLVAAHSGSRPFGHTND
jgi:hypothetical protein